MNISSVFQIDIHEVLRNKAPKIYPKIPKFLINALAKFLCIDKLNTIISDNPESNGVDLMEKAVERFNIHLKIEGEENLPDLQTRCIFASNHPLGGLDGICLSAFLGKRYEKHIIYLVNDILYFIRPLQEIFVPINKHGTQGREAARALNDAFASENQIITFPAGLCSRKIKGKICDLEWKKMFIVKAVEYRRNVVPVYFEAQNSRFFYTVAALRKKLHIKFNIEMILLPREMFKAKNSTFTIHFGKMIPWQTFDTSRSPQQWADELKRQVYSKKLITN